MHPISHYQDIVLNHFQSLVLKKEPSNLYEPIRYILSLGGKRLRPVLTLIHDDIMDDAPLRRGNETVHEKWDINTGILSGDAMLILAYQYFEEYEPSIFRELAKLFSKTALEVCEGQQYDVDFETRDDVTISEYLKMIEYKTAVLVGAAMKMGAIVAQTSEENANLIYDFGLNLGLAFQLQDDYLDAFGDPKTFGKQVGGDIIENKKTYLYLKAVEFASEESRKQLTHLFSIQPDDNTSKIDSVKEIFDSTGASEATKKAIKEYTLKAFEILQKLDISDDKKDKLQSFGENLMGRKV